MKKLLPIQRPEVGLALLRIGFGLMLVLVHGWPTLKGFVSGNYEGYPDPIGLGSAVSMGLMVFTEFFCAILVTLGLYTRVALIPIIVGFLIAFFVFHGSDPFGQKELAFHYLIVFTVLFIGGSGKLTLLEIINKLKTNKK